MTDVLEVTDLSTWAVLEVENLDTGVVEFSDITAECDIMVEVAAYGERGATGPAGPPGSPGAPGQDGAGGSYVFVQDSPLATWTVVHELGIYPNVTVVDSAGTAVEGDVIYDSLTTVRLLFSSPFAGTAYLS